MDRSSEQAAGAEGAAAPRVVVGVAVIRDGRVLAARRTAPAATAGGWEFPGGKVDPGESEIEAGVREVREELGCEVRLGRRLASESELPSGLVLRVFLGELVSGEPQPTEHDALRWLARDELHEPAWLPADEPFLAEIADHLPARAGRQLRTEGVRTEAHFDEGDDADRVARTLHAEGFAATLARESFAGEDDSEDRAWLVRVEDGSAAARLADLVAEVDLAWLVEDDAAPAPVPPTLPSAPQRLKRRD